MKLAAFVASLALVAGCDRNPDGSLNAPQGAGAANPALMAAPAARTESPKAETTYYFGVKETHTNITFQSKNELTDILGATHLVTGSATIDASGASGHCELSVPSATLNSGMPDRDRAMKSKAWLDVDKFPTIEFKSEKATLTDKPNGWTVSGKFTLHGKSNDLTIPVEVRTFSAEIGKKLGFGDGPCCKVKTAFKVKLADYGIEIPPTAIATVQPEIAVAIDIWGSTVKPAAPAAVKAPVDDEAPVKMAPKPKVSEEGIDGVKYAFGKKPQLAQIQIISETEAETITTTTKTVAGVLGYEKDKGTGKVRLAVPVDSLDSGIALRNEHLKGPDWLDAGKFKTIEFESTKASKKDEKTWIVEGDFTLHGVKKPITVEVVMREIPLELIQKAHWGETPGLGFRTDFKIKFSDYGIKVPSAAAAKVNDELKISIDLVALQKE